MSSKILRIVYTTYVPTTFICMASVLNYPVPSFSIFLSHRIAWQTWDPGRFEKQVLLSHELRQHTHIWHFPVASLFSLVNSIKCVTASYIPGIGLGYSQRCSYFILIRMPASLTSEAPKSESSPQQNKLGWSAILIMWGQSWNDRHSEIIRVMWDRSGSNTANTLIKMVQPFCSGLWKRDQDLPEFLISQDS